MEGEYPNRAVQDAFGILFSLDYVLPVTYGQSKITGILFTKQLQPTLGASAPMK